MKLGVSASLKPLPGWGAANGAPGPGAPRWHPAKGERLNANIKTLLDSLLPWRAGFRRAGALGGQAGAEAPLRAELFSADQMERHGRVRDRGHHFFAHGEPTAQPANCGSGKISFGYP